MAGSDFAGLPPLDSFFAGAASAFPEEPAFIFFFVAGPTLPSTSRPCSRWYSLILSTVPVPIFPSTSAPTTFCTQA